MLNTTTNYEVMDAMDAMDKAHGQTTFVPRKVIDTKTDHV